MMARSLRLAFLGCLLLVGCASLSLEQRRSASSHLAINAGWHRLNLVTDPFVLAAFVPTHLQLGEVLTIYIEGDGLAWIDSSTPSLDPTPLNALALKLAMKHPSGAVAYLARPCQYIAGEDRIGCEKKYWTSHRFSPVVVESTNTAIEKMKQRFHAKNIELIGYSGGGAIATLVAAKRNDVTRLITIAGNLDHEAWTSLHHISRLSGSLNPASAWLAVVNIPQLHFVGAKDSNMPLVIAQSYQAQFPESKRPELMVVDGMGHDCCWVENWPALYAQSKHQNVFTQP